MRCLGVCACGLWLAAAVVAPDSARAGDELDLVAVSRETDRLAEASFQEMIARERRMIGVATRVRRASVELCGRAIAPILGLEVMTTRELPAAYVTSAIRNFGVEEKLRVIWVLPGSPAERGGLVAGDVIASVDGFKVETEQDLNNRRAASGATVLRFAIQRAGKDQELEVPYEPGCYVQPVLALSSQFNAYASREESRVVVFSELIREVKNDDELAAVIGHELGHIVLGHDKSAPNAEADADYFGLYLAARAGYDPKAGAEIWRQLSRTRPWALQETDSHPSGPQRVLAAERAVEEIAVKRAEGRPLRPEGLE